MTRVLLADLHHTDALVLSRDQAALSDRGLEARAAIAGLSNFVPLLTLWPVTPEVAVRAPPSARPN